MSRVLLLCSLVGAIFGGINGYKILGVFPVASKSHYYVGHALMKGLALEGHEVTVISPFRLKQPIPNYTEVYLENAYESFLKGNCHGDKLPNALFAI